MVEERLEEQPAKVLRATADQFFGFVSGLVPRLPPEECAEAVFCALAERVSGGNVRGFLAELPEGLRHRLEPYSKTVAAPARAFAADELFSQVAEHLGVELEEAKEICQVLFQGFHSLITDEVSERLASQLPRELKEAWVAARKVPYRPH